MASLPFLLLNDHTYRHSLQTARWFGYRLAQLVQICFCGDRSYHWPRKFTKSSPALWDLLAVQEANVSDSTDMVLVLLAAVCILCRLLIRETGIAVRETVHQGVESGQDLLLLKRLYTAGSSCTRS